MPITVTTNSRQVRSIACTIAVACFPLVLGLAQQTPASPPQSKPSQSGEAPQFYDTPQFTVSGVTDTSNVGGHGSGTVLHTRDTLAKETASLGKREHQPAPSESTMRSLRERAEREPGNAEAHHQLAEAEEGLGDSLAAVHEYQRAAELEPSEPNLFDWGSDLLLHHAPEPAIEVFTKGNRAFPKSSRMLTGLGAALFARGFDDQAIERICEVSALNPNDATPYLYLGKMLEAYTTPPDALVEALHRFASQQPNSAEANYYYAAAQWKKRKSPQDAAEIESLLNRALHINSGFAPAHLQMGILYFERRDYPKAISEYRAAMQYDPQSEEVREEAHYRLAQAYRQTGEEEKAKAELKLYEEMAKQSAEHAERERHELQQFVYTLRDQPPPQKP